MVLTTISNLRARTFDLLLSRGLILNRRRRCSRPRSGKARCDDERRRADAATTRLRALINRGDGRLIRVACSCRPGQEGTRYCNYGRLCGSLSIGGRDVGQILTSEGLAHPYVCGRAATVSDHQTVDLDFVKLFHWNEAMKQFQRADEAILDGRRKHPEMDAWYQEATKKTATRRLF